MLLLRQRGIWLLSMFFVWAAQPVWADEPLDPLRLIPSQADFVVKVENPSQIVQNTYELDLVKNLQKISAIRDFYDSTNARRVNQLIGYFEKELGFERYELLDKLAGNGIVFALKIEKNPSALFVIQGKDEATTQKFVTLALKIAEDEYARLEIKKTIKHKTYKGIDAYQLDDAYMAVAGSALLVSNKPDALKASVDMYLGKSEFSSAQSHPSLTKARKTLPPNPQAWAWLNLRTIQKIPDAKKAFEQLAENKANHLNAFTGAFLLAEKAPYVCAGFYLKEGGRYETTFRYPNGLDSFPKDVAETFYPDEKEGILPLLEPKNVLFSTSYYLDLAEFWKNRKEVLPKQALKGFADLEKNSGRFLGGTKIGQLMEWSGSHQRFVMAEQTRSVYKKKKSAFNIPSFALVHEMRDEAFAKASNRILRTVALFGAGGFDLKMDKIKRHGVTIVSYRFPEDKEIKGDKQNIRYSFSPSFFWVNDQFVVSSTRELAEDLVDSLQKEKNPKELPYTTQTRFYGSGVAVLLQNLEEQLITLAVLGQALSPEEARREVNALINAVNQLGTLETDVQFTSKTYRLNIALDLK